MKPMSKGLETHPARIYTPEELEQFDYQEDLGYPGEYPFTRGIQSNMYRGKLWTMRQYSGFASAEESNKRFRYLLEQGQSGLSVAFDLPTQMGYDSDHPLAMAEVGKVGVAIDSLSDMEALFNDIPLDTVSTSMTINATTPVLLAMYIALAQKQGCDIAKLKGTIQNDILKEYIARGTYIFPPCPSMRLITDIFKYCSEHLPRWNTISINGYHIREAGSTATQEVGFTLANGIAYVQAGIDAGLNVDTFAGRLSFMFQIHNNFFEEVVKLRAARRLWAKIMRERFKATEPRSLMLRTHVQTGGSTLTLPQPLTNIARGTIQALAAVLGGVQSLAVASYDEALCTPTEEAAVLSLRVQQIIAYESGVVDTVDPLGGSYFVEHLTSKIEEEANQYIHKIDDLGGAISAIELGFQQREIQESSYQYQRDVESGKKIVVGINKFVSQYSKPTSVSKVDPRQAKKQIERLRRIKQSRDQTKVASALQNLEMVARGSVNTMPAFIKCVKAYCTIGEICDVLRGVFGTHKEFIVF